MSQNEFFVYFGDKIAERRAEPRDDLITDVVHATLDGEPLPDDEMLAMFNQFLVAGNETTTKLITSAVLVAACSSPSCRPSCAHDPSLIPGFIEEALRLEPPVQGLYRTAVVDTEVGGVPIPAGAHLLLVYAAGNRDEREVRRAPSRLDPCRPQRHEPPRRSATASTSASARRWPGPKGASARGAAGAARRPAPGARGRPRPAELRAQLRPPRAPATADHLHAARLGRSVAEAMPSHGRGHAEPSSTDEAFLGDLQVDQVVVDGRVTAAVEPVAGVLLADDRDEVAVLQLRRPGAWCSRAV